MWLQKRYRPPKEIKICLHQAQYVVWNGLVHRQLCPSSSFSKFSMALSTYSSFVSSQPSSPRAIASLILLVVFLIYSNLATTFSMALRIFFLLAVASSACLGRGPLSLLRAYVKRNLPCFFLPRKTSNSSSMTTNNGWTSMLCSLFTLCPTFFGDSELSSHITF